MKKVSKCFILSLILCLIFNVSVFADETISDETFPESVSEEIVADESSTTETIPEDIYEEESTSDEIISDETFSESTDYSEMLEVIHNDLVQVTTAIYVLCLSMSFYLLIYIFKWFI